MGKKYKFIFEYAGAKVVCYSTQKEISKMLADPTVKLISVNDNGYRVRYTKKKR